MEQNRTYAAGSIGRIRTKLTSGQLEISPAKGADIQLMIAGDEESMEELRVELSGDTLMISQPQLAYAKEIIRRKWLQICLRIPQGWHGEVDAATVSGTMSAYGFGGTEVSLSTVSGSLSVRDIAADMLFLHTVSADIAGAALEARRCNLRSVSGSIALDDVALGGIKVFTVSGHINLSLKEMAKTIDSQSVSGSLTVETDGPVKAALHSLSGQFIMDDELTGAQGGLGVTASSVSGDLAVRRRKK